MNFAAVRSKSLEGICMNKLEFDQVVGLTHFLEKYTQQMMDAGKNKVINFSDTDKKIWDSYFETLIKPGILPDGMAFHMPNNDTNIGIGSDGAASREEFLQLLMQCYKYLYLALSSGEVFLKHKNWYTSDGKEVS